MSDAIAGDVAVGRFVLHIGEASGAALHEASRTERAHFRSRPSPILLRPRVIRGLVDRRTEVEAAVSGLDARIPVEVSGAPGIGKTAVLRHLAHHPRAAAFVDGIAYLSARHQSSVDLLQRIFDAFYERDANGKPTAAEIRRGLEDKHALILLDEVDLPQNELEAVLDIAPRCAFVVATRERCLWGEVRSLVLTGLPVDDAVVLLERAIERSFDVTERAAAVSLCTALGGHPLRIEQAAVLIRDRGLSPDAWTRHVAAESVIAESLTSIDEKQRRVLLALAALPGVPLTMPHVSGIAELPDVESSLAPLVRRGLVLGVQSRYHLADGVADRLRRSEDLKPWVNRAITYFTGWAERHRRHQESLLDETDALLRAQQYARDERRWGEVLRLGRLLEATLAVGTRWGAWGITLERCLAAARAIGDRPVEAWALHQMGTRAVCLGETDNARRFLGQSASLRESLGEPAAAAVSRRNLGFVLSPRSTTLHERDSDVAGDVSDLDSAPLRDEHDHAWPAPSKRTEIGALIVVLFLFALLGGFAYEVFQRRTARAPAAGPVTTPPAVQAAAEPQTPPATAAPVAEKASILIFTARPGSIATPARPTDVCYAVSDATQARIEPGIGDVDPAATLTCRRVAPARTTTYELSAVGRDGVPVTQQLVIVVR